MFNLIDAARWAAGLLFVAWLFKVLKGAAYFAYQYLAARHLPTPKAYSVFFGHVANIMRDPIHSTMLRWADQLGPLYRIRFLHSTLVVLTEPEAVARVLRHGTDVDEYMPKMTLAYAEFEKMTSPHHPNILTNPDNADWKAVRRGTAPAFTSNNLRTFYPDVVFLMQRLLNSIVELGPDAELDMDKAALRLTADVIGRFAFGHDSEATLLRENEFINIIDNMLIGMQLRFNPFNRWFTWLKEAKVFPKWSAQFTEVVSREVTKMRAQPPPPHTLMGHLLNVKDAATGQPISDDALKSEVGLFWIAGYETTAHAIGWTLFLLATHPQTEAQVVSELGSLGLLPGADGSDPRGPTWQELGKMPFTNAVIHEALRLFPPASSGTIRKAEKDFVVKGCGIIPKGATVWLPTYAIQRSTNNWPGANDFKPERWLNKDSSSAAAATASGGAAAVGKVDKDLLALDTDAGGEIGGGSGGLRTTTFLPFSEGPRNCVGQALAMMELRVAVAMFIAKFTLKLTPAMGSYREVEAAARQYLTLKPGGGMMMHCIPRRPVAA